jgi:alanine racemase
MNPPWRCWAEVDLEALRENLAWLRHFTGPQLQMMAVVKADAYGHGLKPIAALLMQNGADLFGTANIEEAQAVRKVGPGWPVLMLGPCLPEEIELAVRDNIMPTISSNAEGRLCSSAAQRQGKQIHVHLKVDTGMGRLGVAPEKAVALMGRLSSLPRVTLAGLWTHFSSAEDDPEFTNAQQAQFEGVHATALKAGFRIPAVHSHNSAGILHQPPGCSTLVRPGLLVYGIVPPGRRTRQDAGIQEKLRPALSFKCRVGLVRTIKAGTPISYGQTFTAPHRMRIATLTAGYGDGLMRTAGNRAAVLIRGHRCKVVGRVTMDQVMVDVTGIPEVNQGEQAVLIGRQGNEEITAVELARCCETIPWEILTSITYRVPRIYTGGVAA